MREKRLYERPQMAVVAWQVKPQLLTGSNEKPQYYLEEW